MLLDYNMKICIVGLGLMGGSYAQALSDLGFEVGAVDVREQSVRFALERGLIRHGRTGPDPEYLGQFDLLIFALYPGAFLDWIRNNQQHLKSGALLTDVTGVKGCVVYRVQELLRADLEFIAAHPMAGRECSGVENAKKEIFRDGNYIVVPTERNTPQAITACRQLGQLLGFANIAVLSPEKHDEVVAFLSQLTHCIAIALMTCRDTTSLARYSGDSFRDLTRIDKNNDEMWSELFLRNREQLLEQMDLFERSFRRLREEIAHSDREALRADMRRSTRQRALFDQIDKTEGNTL